MTDPHQASEALLSRELQFCGLNGDWSVSAWHAPRDADERPNWETGGVYVLDFEDSDDPSTAYHVVRRWYIEEPGYPSGGDGCNDHTVLVNAVGLDAHDAIALAREIAEANPRK